MTVRIIQNIVGNTRNQQIKYDQENPPIIFFDTNVWRRINDGDIVTLQRLQQKNGFFYCYSVTNFVELVSHLEDQPSKSCPEPFGKYQGYFGKIREICDGEILPSPEEVFLTRAGLENYIDPVWIVRADQMAHAVKLIIDANSLAQLKGEEDGNSEKRNEPIYVVKPSHYRKLREIDGRYWQYLMEGLHEFKRPIASADDNKLSKWFLKLFEFFLFVRPTSGKFLKDLTSQEQDRFLRALIGGVGELLYTHCGRVVRKTVDDRRKIYPNDLYDMLQLILLEDDNTLFVTSDKAFFLYQISPDQPQRVLNWTSFVSSL